MYRHSPIRNPRSKGCKTKNVLQVCLLVAVCFWLIFQVKRSHDKKKEFDNTKKGLVDKTDISLNTNKQSNEESFKLGRKDLQPKFEKDVEISEEHEEQDEEHEEQDEEHEEKIDGEKDDGGGGGDDEIDEHEQEKSDVEVGREETEVVDEESQTENENENGVSVSVDEHEENGGSIHTHEGREEHYKADDASSAVVTTHLATTENGTLEEISVNNQTSSLILESHENGPPSNTVITTSNQTEGVSNSSYVSEVLKTNESNRTSDGLKTEIENGESENLEGREEILDPDEIENETHLEEKEVRMDLDTLPEIETEGGNSEEEDTAVERR